MAGDSLCTPFNQVDNTDTTTHLYPHEVKWIGSTNYTLWRSGWDVRAIVLHTMGGYLAGSDAWFNNPSSQVSAHFGIGLNGDIHQYVDLNNTAWANGILESGNKWQFRFGSTNPNYRTVSIETEDRADPTTPVTQKQFDAVLYTCTLVSEAFVHCDGIVPHYYISPQTRPNCPGDRWMNGRIQELAKEVGLELWI